MSRASWASIIVVFAVLAIALIDRIGVLTLITPGADADSSLTSSASGLEFISGDLTLLRGCADSQGVGWSESTDTWDCTSSAGYTDAEAIAAVEGEPTLQLAGVTTFGGNWIITDDTLAQWGTDSDVVAVLNSAGLAANEELASVIVGTSIYPATIPANSLVFSNTTANGDMVFFTNVGGNSIEIFRIEASTRLLLISDGNGQVIGHTAQVGSGIETGVFNLVAASQVIGTGPNDSSFALHRSSDSNSGPYFSFAKSRSAVVGVTVLQDGDNIGTLIWSGADGTDLNTPSAVIRAQVDGTPGSNDMPGRLIFETTADGEFATTERMRINSDNTITFLAALRGDTDGDVSIANGFGLIVGHPTQVNAGIETGAYNLLPELQITGTGPDDSALGISRYVNSNSGGYFSFARSRNATIGGNTVLQANDNIGTIIWSGNDGTDNNTPAAVIRAQVDGTPGSNDMPGRLIFETTADGASSTTERLRINADGSFTFPATTLGTSAGSLTIDPTTSTIVSSDPLIIQNVSQNTSPGTTINGQIRLWEDADAGGGASDGRILYQINGTTYQVNADSGLTFSNNPLLLARDKARFALGHAQWKLDRLDEADIDFLRFSAAHPELELDRMTPEWSKAYLDHLRTEYAFAAAVLNTEGSETLVTLPHVPTVTELTAENPWPDPTTYTIPDATINETQSPRTGTDFVKGDALVLGVDRLNFNNAAGENWAVHTVPALLKDEILHLMRTDAAFLAEMKTLLGIP